MVKENEVLNSLLENSLKEAEKDLKNYKGKNRNKRMRLQHTVTNIKNVLFYSLDKE